MMSLAEQLEMSREDGNPTASLCPDAEVHLESWELRSNGPLGAEGLSFFLQKSMAPVPASHMESSTGQVNS